MHINLNNIVLMKYGAHAGESSDDIIQRKQLELEDTGKVYWGYGGNLCHPLNQIQPFLEENREKDCKTYLVLVKTKTESQVNSGSFYLQDRSIFYSHDKLQWYNIPSGNNVTGSKYALICNSFEHVDISLDLSQYRIPLGAAKDCRISDYLGWRKNKACGRYSEKDLDIAIPKIVKISVVAEIENAVFIR